MVARLYLCPVGAMGFEKIEQLRQKSQHLELGAVFF